MATSLCTPADGQLKTIKARVEYILTTMPSLRGNYNAIIAVYWKMYDEVESIDDLIKETTTPVTSIDRAVREVLYEDKLLKEIILLLS